MLSKGSSRWFGPWPGGHGTLSTEGSSLNNLRFDAASRFEHGDGGSPEELVAAAFAACVNNALANVLSWGNYVADSIETNVDFEVVVGNPGGVPGSLHVTLEAKVPGIRPDQFQGMAVTALRGCIIGRFLNVEPTMEATLLD